MAKAEPAGFLVSNNWSRPPGWAEPFRAFHWGKHNVTPFPKEKSIHEGITMNIVQDAATLNSDVHHPLMIRPQYEEIRKKLLDKVLKDDQYDRRGLCIFGRPGSGELADWIVTDTGRQVNLPLVPPDRHDPSRAACRMGDG